MAREYTEISMVFSDVPLGALALPDAAPAGRMPAVLLLPDVWGLSELYRGFAGRLAAEGFAVLALDPYGTAVEITDPGSFLRGRSDPEMMARIGAALGSLRSHAAVDASRVGVVGFCIGGTQSLLAACTLPGLSACVSFYGILSYEHGLLYEPSGRDLARKPRDPLTAIADLRCPLLGLFGGRDEFVPAEDVRALEAGAARSGQRVEIRLYPEAGHAFLNETRPQAFRPDDARDAWRRTVDFLRRELSASEPR
jgi:carboxymethylenebutenolidase